MNQQANHNKQSRENFIKLLSKYNKFKFSNRIPNGWERLGLTFRKQTNAEFIQLLENKINSRGVFFPELLHELSFIDMAAIQSRGERILEKVEAIDNLLTGEFREYVTTQLKIEASNRSAIQPSIDTLLKSDDLSHTQRLYGLKSHYESMSEILKGSDNGRMYLADQIDLGFIPKIITGQVITISKYRNEIRKVVFDLNYKTLTARLTTKEAVEQCLFQYKLKGTVKHWTYEKGLNMAYNELIRLNKDFVSGMDSKQRSYGTKAENRKADRAQAKAERIESENRLLVETIDKFPDYSQRQLADAIGWNQSKVKRVYQKL